MAKFTFATEASPVDSKTTVILVKQMQLEDGKNCFAFPTHLKSALLHADLFAHSTAKLAKKLLTSQNMTNQPWIALSEDLTSKYLDNKGNPVFRGVMLQPAPQYLPQILTPLKSFQTIEEST